jgi:hypothetical protein
MNYPVERRQAEGRHANDAEGRRGVSLPRSLAYLALAATVMVALGGGAFAALAQ